MMVVYTTEHHEDRFSTRARGVPWFSRGRAPGLIHPLCQGDPDPLIASLREQGHLSWPPSSLF
jgi:hypothetical protein